MSVQIYHPLGEGGQLSGFDEKLLEMATQRISPEEMYARLGSPESLSPARCLQRVREIVRSTDYLTILDQKALLLLDFVRLRDILWDRIEGTELKITKHGDTIEVGSAPGWANAMIRVLKEWRVTIDSMQKDLDGGQLAVSRAHAEVMMAAISVMFDRFIGRLEDHYRLYQSLPEATDMREMFEEVMPLGFAKIEGSA